MRSTSALAWICLLAAAFGVPARLSQAELRDGAGVVKEREQDPSEPEVEWAAERALVDEARAALGRSDYRAARERVGRAIDALLSKSEAERGGSWLELLERAGRTAMDAQDLANAKRVFEQVLEVRSASLPANHRDVQGARLSLAVTMFHLGDLQGARTLQEATLEVFVQTLPEDHPHLQSARGNLAITLRALGDLAGARELFEAVLEVSARTLSADHPDLQAARGNLASTMWSSGDLHGARELFEALLEVHSRTLPEDHPHLSTTRMNLGATRAQLGDLSGARELFEAALEVNSRTLPADHPRLQSVRGNLAEVMRALGDLSGARALFEVVLEINSRTLPADHPHLQSARGNLAGALRALGDLAAARALYEAVLEVRTRTLPADHRDLQAARANLATTLRAMGDLQGARELHEAALEVLIQTLAAEHTDLFATRLNVAATRFDLGDLAGARALQEQVLELGSRTLPADHPHLLTAQANLALTLRAEGDLDGARGLQESVLEVLLQTLPADHPDLQSSRLHLAETLAGLAASAARDGDEGEGEGEWPRAQALTAEAARVARGAAGTALWTSSVREAEERVASRAERPLGNALSFAAGLGQFESSAALIAHAFELSEATRAAALAGTSLARAPVERAARERYRAEMLAASEGLAELAQRGGTREEYHLARERREAAERELLGLAREQSREGLGALDVSVGSLAAALGPEQALVGLRRYVRSWLEEIEAPERSGETQFALRLTPSLGAFVLRSVEGEPRLAFVDLGALAELEPLVGAWREAIRATPERGLGLEAREEDPALAIGRRLRAAVWDPLVQHLGETQRVVVALDDVLHLIPLDALPLEAEGELVGDRWRLETRIALWELLDAPRAASERIALVSLGGAAFNSEPKELAEQDLAAIEVEDEGLAALSQSVALLRGGAWERGFAPLTYTRTEARGLAELFAEAFEDRFEDEVPALVLDRARASREALVEAAPRARFLHVATHGWFAPESVRSWADGDDSTRSAALAQRLSGEDTVRGMSPMLLCGLALAGANLPANAAGRVPGLVTAEELSTLDLTGCELAVLSACDTNVGERRAGQGVASLQKALHMAGARSVITSLWKVPDEATSELMLDFYRRLWVEHKPKHQALWEAKLRLRHATDERGEPLYTVRDWAAWVLTGDPD